MKIKKRNFFLELLKKFKLYCYNVLMSACVKIARVNLFGFAFKFSF